MPLVRSEPTLSLFVFQYATALCVTVAKDWARATMRKYIIVARARCVFGLFHKIKFLKTVILFPMTLCLHFAHAGKSAYNKGRTKI